MPVPSGNLCWPSVKFWVLIDSDLRIWEHNKLIITVQKHTNSESKRGSYINYYRCAMSKLALCEPAVLLPILIVTWSSMDINAVFSEHLSTSSVGPSHYLRQQSRGHVRGICRDSSSFKNPPKYAGIYRDSRIQTCQAKRTPGSHLEYQKNIRQINSFFLTWHTLWPKLTKETFHSFASKPHTYELVDPLAQQWFNISKDPSYTSPTIQPRHQTPLLEKAKIRHSLALHENQHLATAVNPQFECKKWKKTPPRNQEIQIGDHFRFRQTKVQIHRFPFQKRINLSLCDRIFEASPKTRLWGTAKWGRTSK